MLLRIKSVAHPSRDAFALVITLIMVVLAAIIVIALLSSASSERLTANSYSNRFRAEIAAQSGLAAALNALVGATGPNDFRFITAVGDDGKPTLIPLAAPDPNGVVSLDTTAKRLLYSVSAVPATITLSNVTNPKVTRQAGFIPVTNTSNQETERYAFYIDEGASRQNLAMQGGNNRLYARDPNELPLATAAAAPVPFTAQQTNDVKAQRPLIFTAPTANSALSNPVTPPVDNYSYATTSTLTNLSPEGKPRVNLSRLKTYVDGLAVDQAGSNPRAAVVDRLLNSSEQGSEWGGGNLYFLTKLSHYTSTQCHQIIANLLDYIDSDLIPTTDNADNPTYFGMEGQAKTDGTVSGHPYINFVGTGLIFNRSSAAGREGSLNSTHLLCFLGIVNSWAALTKNWDTFYVSPEIEIELGGTASGGTLGSDPNAYFVTVFDTNNYEVVPADNHLLEYPALTIPPNAGYLFPHTVAGNLGQYNTFKDLKTSNSGGPQPPGMTFSNITFKIKRLRLKYFSTDGTSGYVQLLDGLNLVAQPMSQAAVNMGTGTGALVYRLGQTGNTTKLDFHLGGDARLNFIPQPSPIPKAIWILSKSTASSTNSDPVSPPSPNPASGVNVFVAADNANYDFAPRAPSATDYTWYTKTDITSNFYVKSPPSDGTAPRLDSIGELGYLHTGIPWETLRLYVTGNETNGKQRDKELLAYVQPGTFSTADYGIVPTHLGQANPTVPIPNVSGPINVNTNKRSTLQSLFLGASALLDSDATAKANGGVPDPDAVSLADAVATNAATAPFALPGDYFALSSVKSVTNAQTTDFNCEVLARRTANVLGTQSAHFTVYSLGEARDKAGANVITTSSVNLRAEVELQTDSTGKPVPKVLRTAYYLAN